jgi:hypothetical protein
VADLAWQADTTPAGYATYLRQFSIKRGWLGPVIHVSRQFGNPTVWPGDTFGLSALPGGDRTFPATRVALSWGSGTTPTNTQIYAAVVHLPPTPAG